MRALLLPVVLFLLLPATAFAQTLEGTGTARIHGSDVRINVRLAPRYPTEFPHATGNEEARAIGAIQARGFWIKQLCVASVPKPEELDAEITFGLFGEVAHVTLIPGDQHMTRQAARQLLTMLRGLRMRYPAQMPITVSLKQGMRWWYMTAAERSGESRRPFDQAFSQTSPSGTLVLH